MTKQDILRQYFGYTAFRGGQEALIDAVLAGRDVLGIMPTGGGKSLCYQIPAMLLEGITLVVSPLISLMKDQVMALKAVGIPAAYINSSLTPEQISLVCRNMLDGRYKIVYIAPERLEVGSMIDLIRRLPIAMLAVDEAHCISQWGQDFRPSYLKIIDFLENLPRRPILAAYTATATQAVREDITAILQLQNPLEVVTGFDRPNLSFSVITPKGKPKKLLSLVEARKEKSGIIYCSTRSAVERVCDSLREQGISATRYHAGLTDEERRENQDAFIRDEMAVMVATNAFGMGINKSNVNYVIHYNMPMSLEAYYQEAGRAGRDGTPAECILLFNLGDVRTATTLIESSEDKVDLTEAEREQLRTLRFMRLNQMIDYCKTTKCLRGVILDYFGQNHSESCGSCSNCQTTFTQRDITREAQMIFSCVKRIYDKLGYYVGKALVVSTLQGSTRERVCALGLQDLSTYGLMREKQRADIRALVDYLIERGYLAEGEYNTLRMNPEAANVLFRGEQVTMPMKEMTLEDVVEELHQAKQTKRSRKKRPQATVNEYHSATDILYERLKAVRADIARFEHVPPYIIFSNATLMDMAMKKPVSVDELLTVSGVGSVKAERYGAYFLEAVVDFMNEKIKF
ncbi:MAG: DNA helicase RecQ [Clostridia bacterium]|nr:DNA helicase RecQ [Clostridia bacterium]